jgi:hypothetical protein
MNIPKTMGRYRGSLAEWGVSESGDNKTLTFSCLLQLTQFQQGTEWVDVSQHGYEITGYFYLFKKNGSPNTMTIDSLKAALGWDGRSIAALNDGDWSTVGVQVLIGEEEYNGKTRTKVRYINPWDYVGGAGVEKADSQTIRSLDAMYGAKLRALSGPATAPASNNNGSADAAKREAWEAFKTENASLTGDARAAAWKKELADLFPGKSPDKFTAGEWASAAKLFKQPKQSADVPFGDLPDSGEINPDDIPF